MRHTLKPLLLLALAAGAPSALAQGYPGLDLERLQLDPSAAGSLVIGSGEVGAAGAARTSMSVGYQHNPLVLLDDGTFRGRGAGTTNAKVGALVGDRYTVALGLSLAVVDRLELFLRAPFVAWQHGFNLVSVGVDKPLNAGMGTPSGGLRLGVVSQAEGAPLSVAVAADLFPSWGTQAALAGNGSFAWAPRVEAGRRFERFQVAAQGYALFRESGIPLRGGEIAGNEYGGGVALSTVGRSRAEVSYRFSLNEYKLSTSSEVLAGVRTGAGPVEAFALAGPGFGGAPGTPTWRALAGIALGNMTK
jgi:OmpA-OmpF porin, OOP family